MATLLTKNWQKTGELYVGNTGYGNVYLRFYNKYSEQEISNNRSYVYHETRLYLDYNGTVYTGATTTKGIYAQYIGEQYGVNAVGTYYGVGETTLMTKEGWVTHDSSGNLTMEVGGSFHSTPWGWGVSDTVTVSLPNIPRYATSVQSLNSKTETTIKMNWSSDNTIDYIWYTINNGSSWVGIDVTDGKSGTYTISGLSPNTTYNIKTRVRRKDSQLTTDSSLLSITTYKAPSHSLKSKTETSIMMNWSADSTVDYLWYSKDNGSNWAGVDVTDGTSGTYTISGLTANTAYNIKTRVRRKATQTTYDTSVISITTYNYPYITAVETSNLTIGNAQKLTLYNPLGRTVTIKMNQNTASGTQLYSSTTTSTSITFTPTTSTLYASIPNSQSGKCVYSAVYSSSTKSTTGNYTYKIKGDEKPTFSNFTFQDTNATTVGLTGSNQKLVDNYSNCKFIISNANKAVAKNSAAISKYIISWNKTADVAYSSSAEVNGTISAGKGSVIKITAVDSRGLSTVVSKTITNIPYANSVINSLSTERENGVDVITYLSSKVSIWAGKWDNSSRANDIIYVGYRTKSSTTWSSYFDITSSFKTNATKQTANGITTYTLASNILEIHANGSSGGFTIGTKYDIQLLVRDGYGTYYVYSATATGEVTDGKIGLARHKDSSGEYHYAINAMSDDAYTLLVGGLLGIASGIHIKNTYGALDYNEGIKQGNDLILTHVGDKTTLLASESGSRGIYFRPNGISNTTGQVTIGTDGSFNLLSPGSNADLIGYKQNGNTILRHSSDGATTLSSQAVGLYFKPNGSNNSTGQAFLKPDGSLNLSTIGTGLGYMIGGNSVVSQSTNGASVLASNSANVVIRPNGASNSTGQAYLTPEGVFVIPQIETIPLLTNSVSSTTWYRLLFSIGSSTQQRVRSTSNLLLGKSKGTTSTIGSDVLVLGNSTASGTADNSRGELRLYNHSSGYVNLLSSGIKTSGYNVYLPDHAGYTFSATELYKNTSGTTGTITLSETSANFSFLEIFYGKLGQEPCRVYSPNGKTVYLSESAMTSSTWMQTVSKKITISGTSITTDTSYSGYGNIPNGSTGQAGTENQIKIYLVIGWQ